MDFVQIPYTTPFQMSKTVITQRQWHDVMKTKPWAGKPYVMDDDDCPATYVSWYDATEFCKRLSTNGKTYRLPTETEWEFACRGGSAAHYHFGNDEKDLDKYAWFWDNCKNEPYAHRVAQKLPNRYGLYDMHGNVWEWCQDSVGSSRVLRGGSWDCAPYNVRCANRYSLTPVSRYGSHGFRVVCECG